MATDRDRREEAWSAAGRSAAALVEDGMLVGLGTGRAAAAAIRALGDRVRGGLRCRGVATSPASARVAREAGIPLTRLRGDLDLALDGADAVDPAGLVVKGAGGALVRERLVSLAAGRFVVLVDDPKLVGSLDEWGRLPAAVLPFALARALRALHHLRPVPRPGRSDDGLALVDVRPPAGADWAEVAATVAAAPGVVDHGLFRVALRDVLVGRPGGTVVPADRARTARAGGDA